MKQCNAPREHPCLGDDNCGLMRARSSKQACAAQSLGDFCRRRHLSRLGLWMSVESTFISVYSQVCLEMRRAS